MPDKWLYWEEYEAWIDKICDEDWRQTYPEEAAKQDLERKLPRKRKTTMTELF